MKKSLVLVAMLLSLTGLSAALSQAAAVKSMVGTWTGTATEAQYDGTTCTKNSHPATIQVKGQSGSMFFGTLTGNSAPMNFTGNITGNAFTLTVLSPADVRVTFDSSFSAVPGGGLAYVNNNPVTVAVTTNLSGLFVNGQARDTVVVINGAVSGKTLTFVGNVQGGTTVTGSLIRQ